MGEIRKAGCIVISIVGLLLMGFFVFLISIFGNTKRLTNKEAVELLQQANYIELEKYVFDTNLIDYISYHGDPIFRHQNIWRINDIIVDYDTSMVVINPDNHYYFPSAKKSDSSSTRYISFNDKAAIDSLLGENFSFDSLKSVLQKARDVKVISIAKYDSGDFIEFRLQNNSPISDGFGILSTRTTIELKNEKHIYDELIKIDSTHYRFLEYVQ